ncbi:hypothetical protein CKO20_13670 [Rhodocyclus tenuis]|nr:hypothetical protein [Rhodocyclus tenuis]
MNDSSEQLSAIETRILGTLCEKERTVPDTYPLSLNALIAGCNQKTSRSPVLEVSEAGALRALETLKERGLVSEVSGGRVLRFAQHMEKALGLSRPAAALLTVLLLRGAQTAGELRLNAERLHGFADISSVEAYLEEMAAKQPAALVRELPRAPGTRETRWCQLLGGDAAANMAVNAADNAAAATPTRSDATTGANDDLAARVAVLESEVRELRALVESLQLLSGKAD